MKLPKFDKYFWGNIKYIRILLFPENWDIDKNMTYKDLLYCAVCLWKNVIYDLSRNIPVKRYVCIVGAFITQEDMDRSKQVLEELGLSANR